jgi:putative transposase
MPSFLSPLLAIAPDPDTPAFIKAHRLEFSIRAMCRVLRVHPSGFYAWLKFGISKMAKRKRYLTGLIKQAWLESGCVYGYRKIHHDLLDMGEKCAPNTVAKLMQKCGFKAQIGYKRRHSKYGAKPSVVAANQLGQNFNVSAQDTIWVTDITYIKTHEGWLYLAVVIDLYSRRVVGWSMGARMQTSLALNALLMAVWRRKPKVKVQPEGKKALISIKALSLPVHSGNHS